MWLIFWASSMPIHSFSVTENSKVMKLLLLWVKYQPDRILRAEQTFSPCRASRDVNGNRMLFYPLHPRNCPGQKDGWQGKKSPGIQMSHEPDHVVEEAGELLDTAKGNLQWKLTAGSITNPNVLWVQRQVKLRVRSVSKEQGQDDDFNLYFLSHLCTSYPLCLFIPWAKHDYRW